MDKNTKSPSFFKRKRTLRIYLPLVCLAIFIYIMNFNRLRESKIAKTKLEILKTIQTEPIKDWKKGIEHAIDSLLLDSTSYSLTKKSEIDTIKEVD